MASRTKQKEEARAARLAAEQALLERNRRVRRLRMLGGAIAVAVIVAVVAVIVASSGSSSGLKTGTQANQTVNEVNQLLSGIPQSGIELGSPQARVTMLYYGDLQCPVCAAFTQGDAFSKLLSNDVRSGKVQVHYRNFETATHDPQVFVTQQVAALAAGKQNRFWHYAELFYRQQSVENSGYVTDAFLTGLARQVPGLNLDHWNTDRNDAALRAQVSSDIQAGRAANVQGTPTLIFQGPKGSVQVPAALPTYAQLQQAIATVS